MISARTSFRTLIAIGAATGLFAACSAGVDDGSGGSGPGGTTVGPGSGGASTTTSGGGNSQQSTTVGFVTSGGGMGGEGGTIVNPCGTQCGPTELCTGQNRGIDDNCNGQVDEGCPCGPGEASSCYKGDPSYLDPMYPSCLPGSMSCTENGTWGPCNGGNHTTDLCYQDSPLGCHPISAVPFATVDLFDGTGNFDDNAMTESFEVTCPVGVTPCPAVTGTSNFQALQSGEYTVTYTKTVNGNMDQCTFPLTIGARGLRVELSWNWGQGGARDLDLHLHQPQTTNGWSVGGAQQDCGYGNCDFNDIDFGFSDVPMWFPMNAPPGDPVSWYLDPDPNLNSCYFAPRGVGAQWQANGQGCYNPRLDLDNISCSLATSDPNNSQFCAPENINVDFPPKNQWFRVGVFMFSSSPPAGVTPNLKIFCDGALRGELGDKGYYAPEAPITWDATQGRKWWLAADVIFKEDECTKECIVRPLYLNDDEVGKLPVYFTETQLSNTIGPPYAPIP